MVAPAVDKLIAPAKLADMASGDESDLRLLARLHYLLAALTAASGVVLMPLVWTLLSWFKAALQAADDPPPGVSAVELDRWTNLSAASVVTGVSLIILCLAHAGVLVYVGRCVARRRRRWLVLVFSALHLIAMPLGTALSIFAFVVLSRPNVRESFRPVAAARVHG